MDNYKRLEKIRYAKNATCADRPGESKIAGYRGKNPLRIFLRKAVKAVKQYQIMNDDKVYIANLAVVTSFVCDLNCHGCGQHIPEIKKLPTERNQIDFAEVCRDLDKISSVVDGIGGIALANGEGFLNPNLTCIIDYYARNRKIHRMNVPTNGTVVPNEEILKKMAQNGVTATITSYPCVSEEKRQRLQAAFNQYHIYYSVYEDKQWYLHEYLDEEICDEEEAKQKYCVCERFFMLMQGRLWKCETNATGIKAGLRPEHEGDSICVQTASEEELRNFIIEKNNLEYLESCKHCRGSIGSNVKPIPAGQQMR